jgi:alpha-D-ribose 1-methylphosphonate 5-triphosphate synthase subunit PhnG
MAVSADAFAIGAEERAELLARADAFALEKLADSILATAVGRGHTVRFLRRPEVVLASIRLVGPGDSGDFVVGDAVLTSCSVVLGASQGDGLRPGRAHAAATAAAVCDAEAERDGEHAGAVLALLEATRRSRDEALRRMSAAVMATRLNGEVEVDGISRERS